MMFSQKLNTHIMFKRLAKVLIRLRICAGWSEPLLVAHTTLLEISCHGSYDFKQCGILTSIGSDELLLSLTPNDVQSVALQPKNHHVTSKGSDKTTCICMLV